jgi:hypothetical protein
MMWDCIRGRLEAGVFRILNLNLFLLLFCACFEDEFGLVVRFR